MNIFDEFVEKIKSNKNKDRATVVFLHGDLGSGKTTFTKNLCKYLNLNIEIHSPTFVILKRYDFDFANFKNLIHIDAYRLKSYSELKKIKFEDYLQDKNNLILIEWPSLISDEGLVADMNMFFEHGEKEDERVIKIL